MSGLQSHRHVQVAEVKQGKPAAAFYDLDGTLCSTNVVHAYGFYARNAPTLFGKFKKTSSLLASIPLFLATDLYSRKLFNEIFYRRYKGESEDRLAMMAEELFDEVIRPSIFSQAYEIINQSRKAGYRQVLVTGALDLLANPVAEHLGIDYVLANKLEYANGYATGRIQEPIIAGASKAALIRKFASQHQLDLDQCFAYSDSMSDYPMLAVVGKPAAVNPCKRLKNIARQFDWPVLQFS